MEGNGRRNPSPSRPRSSRRLWLAVAALAALAAAQALAVEVREEREPFFDELRYRLYATNLLERGFYGDEPGKWPATAELRSVGYVAYVPPGYPFFLAGLRWAFGEGDTPIRVTQALLVGATVAAASLIALRLFGPVAAVASAIALIATGVLATYSSFALSEVLATATLTTSVLLALVAFDRRSWRLMVAAGVALGLSALVRPQVLLLPAPLAGWAFLSWGRGRAGAIAALALVGATLFTLTPWTVRNYLRLHSLVPVSTYSWINFWIVNNPKDRKSVV